MFKEVGKELPEQWNPDVGKMSKGDFIEGIYSRKKTEVGKNNATLYILETDGELKSVWGSKVLDDKMDDPKIKVGDTIRITYEGENEKPKYHKYKVEKDFPDIPDDEVPDAAEDGAEEAEQESE